MSEAAKAVLPYQLVIGLEVHVQLSTKTKLFCSCAIEEVEGPNQAVCSVCLGLPGGLPVLNARAFELAVKAALAFDCVVAAECHFDRKHYVYPDLAKNYQISQHSQPLASGGRVTFELSDGETREVSLHQMHLEEDAGRLVHPDGNAPSRIDFNRAGMPLLEIVTAPDLRAPEEASGLMREITRVLRNLGVSDCEMEHGHLRADCNVSVRAHDAPEGELGVRTEIKNLNSFKAVERATGYEGARQWGRLEAGKAVLPQTRLWDEDAGRTRLARRKERDEEYRFCAEPDVPPIRLDRDFLAQVRAQLAELPRARRERFIRQYGLDIAEAKILARTRAVAQYYEAVVKACDEADPKACAKTICQEVLRQLNESNASIDDYEVSAERLASLVDLQHSGRLNKTMARKALGRMLESGCSAEEAAEALGERITSLDRLGALCRMAIDENPKPVQALRRGKRGALKHIIGWVMERTRGKADAQQVAALLRELLALDDEIG